MLTQDCSRRSLFGAAALGLLGVHGLARGERTSHAATVIVFRHAEKKKDGSADPELTKAGRQRAEALAKMLRAAKVTRIFSTKTKRTQATVQPLSKQLELPVESYVSGGFGAKLSAMAGEVVAVSGHSNTVPDMVRALGGELSGLDERDHLPDDEYDRVIVQALWTPDSEEPMRAIQTLDLRLDP